MFLLFSSYSHWFEPEAFHTQIYTVLSHKQKSPREEAISNGFRLKFCSQKVRKYLILPIIRFHYVTQVKRQFVKGRAERVGFEPTVRY